MINRPEERAIKPSFIPKYSDPDILKEVLNSDFWKHLFLGEKAGVWLAFKALFFLKNEMFISPVKAVLRFDHGKRTIGVFMTVMSTFLMIAFNTTYMVGYLATFFPFAAPVVPFFMSGEDMLVATFVSVKSNALLYFWMTYLVISLIHLIRMYKGWGSPETPTTRGHSFLYKAIFRHLRLSEASTKIYIEPVLVGGIGYYLLASGTDFTFGLFLLIAAGCLFFQEIFDALMRFSIS